jgi:sulfite reductase alpha subunit-like flavoprotein
MDLLEDDKKNADEKELVSLLHDWLEIREEKSDRCSRLYDKMKPYFKALVADDVSKVDLTSDSKESLLGRIWSDKDMFPKISQWITGGDGWAYDIGFGGLDHVEAFEANDVNVLVVDTEMYSNTGGQMSKATPSGATVKFAAGGKVQKKKSIGEIFMTYEHVYIASVAISNQAQVLQAFIEADKHDGPSIIIAYAPCIQHGVRPQGLNDMYEEAKYAVDSGYWPLYRFNPELTKEGKNPFVLDSKKLRKEVTQFLQRESRFVNLKKNHPEIAAELFSKMNKDVHDRMDHLNQLASGYKAFDHPDDASVKVLYGSETGTAARVARDFADACTLSHVADAMDDVEVDDIDGTTTVLFIATCGQGAMPANAKNFYKALCQRKEPFKEGTKFMIMGLGDSSYFFYCKAAKDVEQELVRLGATKMIDMGYGDDSAEEGMEEGLHDWLDTVWPALEVPPPAEVPHITPVNVTFSKRAVISPEENAKAIQQYFTSESNKAVSLSILSNKLMCSEDYNRDFRTIRISNGNKLSYNLGDALEIFPQNDPDKVAEFIHAYTHDFDERTVVKMDAHGIHGEISVGAIFTYVLDLFGKPSKHFMQQLATFETDEEERKTMLDLGFLKKAGKETGLTVADALLRFKKAHPPLPALLAIIPEIKPRAYSIASAPSTSPTVIELLVLIDTWWCDEGMRYGLNCDMLRKLHEGDHIWCRMKAGSMDAPEPEQPVVCAGIGSGLAPHMAFLRDHVRAAEAGEKVGPFSLYFGNRKIKEEYLYRSELEDYEKKYDWFNLHAAFSRDDPSKKVYVQDLVAITDDARLLLHDKPDGMLYVCGNRNLPKPLQDALVNSFSERSQDKEKRAAAEKAVEELYVKGRAQQEVW